MKLKYLYFPLFIFFFTNVLQAQYKKGMFSKDPLINLANWDKSVVTWGYYLGFNAYDFKFDYKEPANDIEVNQTTGFNVGLVGDVRLFEHLNLRFEPGLSYTQRNLVYPDIEKPVDAKREVNSTYIYFPLLLKVSSLRTGNIRPYLLGGASASLNLASNNKAKDDNLEQRFRMQRWTNNYELGIGIDFYTEYFKFSPSIRGIFGLKDELIRDKDPNSQWTGNIAAMKTRGLFVNFTFQ